MRVLLLFPIGTALARRLDPRQQTRLETAVLLSLVCSTYFGGCGVFTGSVPNLVVGGQLEKETGQLIYWSTWLMWMFPVIGALRTALSLAVIWFTFGRTLRFPESPDQPVSRGKLETSQRRVIAILILGVALWATDVFHRIPPAHVSLVLVLLYLLPGWGPLSVSSLRKINFPFLFYIAALFSLGAALEKSGFNNHLIAALTSLIRLESFGWFSQHLILTLVAVPFDFLMDIAAVAGVITVPLLQLGMSHGLSPLSIAMSVGMATTLVFLPYQAAPFMVAYSFRRFTLGRLIAAILAISLLSLLLFCPLNIIYWHWLGLVP